jgi:hypothetical protein
MTYVNCIRHECTHYCGRASSRHKAKGDPIDLSIFGNPSPLRFEEDRDENIREYTAYLLDRLRKNKYLVEILRLIPDDAVLGCFCYPKNCHCRPIIEACEYLREHDL